MNHIIIRTCVKDDYLARLCYESFKLAGITGKFVFLADEGEYEYIKIDEVPIIYKQQTNNYGGYAGVVGLWQYGLNNLTFKDTDTVIVSDSDIIVYEDFTKLIDAEHMGVGGYYPGTKILHISGQLQIFNGKTANRLKTLSIDQIKNIVHKEMVVGRINVADDTFNSYMTDKWKCSKKLLPSRMWVHYKAYECDKMDYTEAIEFTKTLEIL